MSPVGVIVKDGALRYDTGKPDPMNLHPAVQRYVAQQADMEPEWLAMSEWFYQGQSLYQPDIAKVWLEADPVLQRGAEKYARLNYSKGMLYSRVMRSFLRHVIAMAAGETTCADFGLPHRSHAMCNYLFALTYQMLGYNGGQWDDRSKFKLEEA